MRDLLIGIVAILHSIYMGYIFVFSQKMASNPWNSWSGGGSGAGGGGGAALAAAGE